MKTHKHSLTICTGVALLTGTGAVTANDVFQLDDTWVVYDPYLVIQANTIYSELHAIPAPVHLTAQVYSRTAAELFRDPVDVPGLHYDIYQADQLTGSTDDTSYYPSGSSSGEDLEFNVVARDSSGRLSSASTISLQTPDDGSNPSTMLSIPTGLRAAVYSSNTLERFWDRQGSGQRFEVYNSDDETLIQTDGSSFFVSNLPLMAEHTYSVRAVNEAGNRPDAASNAVVMDTPDSPSAITLDNAENLLKAVVSIAISHGIWR